MRIGYLILAHSAPEHLQRLINHLSNKKSKIFIHIDKSVDIDLFNDISGDNIFFIDNRVNSRWGAFSLTQATINLIKCALQHGQLDRVQLLSGLDYPVKPIEELEYFLASTPAEFISINTQITTDSKLFYRLKKYM